MTEIDEAELLAAARAGRSLGGAGDGQRRTVPAALLRRCCRELAAQVDPRGLQLRDLDIAGPLDLAGIAVPFPLRFDNCVFDSVFVVEGADLFELALTGCELPGLLGNGLRLRRDLDLSRSVITGSHATSASLARRAAVWLSESAVGGRLICVDTRIDGLADRALHADRIRIGGSARFIHQFTATGEIRLIGARIEGAIEFTGAHVTAAQGLSLDIEGASIAGSMMIIEDPSGRKPEFRGRMDLGGATIAGGILVRNAVIDAGRPGSPFTSYFKAFTTGDAIRARGLSLGGELTLEQSQITGEDHLFFQAAVDDSLAAQRIAQLAHQLAARNIGATTLPPSAKDVPADHMLVVLERYVVTPPNCPDWTKPPGGDPTNSVGSNFGCATATNLGMMVASPRDLLVGRQPGPADAQPGLSAIQNYRAHKPIVLPDDLTGSAAPSSSGAGNSTGGSTPSSGSGG